MNDKQRDQQRFAKTRLLRVPEVAEHLSLSQTHLWHLIGEGEIESVKVGRARLISVAAIEKFVEAHTEEGIRR